MKNPKQRILRAAIAFSIPVIAGILCVVFGAANFGESTVRWALLGAGIALIVLGCLGAAALWVRYAVVKRRLEIRDVVLTTGVSDYRTLSQTFRLRKKALLKELRVIVRAEWLSGWMLGEKGLIRTAQLVPEPIRCPACGGIVVQNDRGWVCPYCGTDAEEK